MAGLPTAKELAERSLRRLLRGGTWAALAREIAWAAARSSGFEHACPDWLVGLVEARLAAQLEGLEALLERAAASAKAEHLQSWPHDLSGAERAALWAGQEEAAQALSRLYADVLRWASRLLDERSCRKERLLRRAWQLRQARPSAEVELPALVAEGLTRSDRFGWPSPASGDR